MPTTRKHRSRSRKPQNNGPAWRYIHGKIDKDGLVAEFDHNPLAVFLIEWRGCALGQEAFLIWSRDGERLLKKHNWTGPRMVGRVLCRDLPEHLARMHSAFGEPWKPT